MRSMSLHQRHKLLILTAVSGSISNLQVALANVGCIPSASELQALLRAVATAGQLDMCRWLLEEGGCKADGDTLRDAAYAGHQAVCELLLFRGAAWCRLKVFAAAQGGHVDLVDWLLLQRPDGLLGPSDDMLGLDSPVLALLCGQAAEGCDLPTLQALHRRCFEVQQFRGLLEAHPWLVGEALRVAAGSPTSDWRAKVEWFESLAPPNQPKMSCACELAALCPDAVARLTWLRQRGYPVDSDVAVAASRNKDAAALEYLLTGEPSVPVDASIVYGAASRCALNTLKRLLARPVPDVDTWHLAAVAAWREDLRMLAWVVEELEEPSTRRKLWTRHLVVAAARSVDLLAWLRARGCPLSAAFTEAAAAGCEDVLEWLVAQGRPMPADGRPYLRAASNSDLATLRCLARLGCPWGPPGQVFTYCVQDSQNVSRAPRALCCLCCPLPVLRCLVELGCPVDWAAATWAAELRSEEVRSWLSEEKRRQRKELAPSAGDKEQQRREQQQRERADRAERRHARKSG